MGKFFCFATELAKRKKLQESTVEDNTFVRKDFYIQPPGPDAKPAEWAAWIEADDKKAAVHKAQHTKSLEHAPVPTWLGNAEGWQAGGLGDRVVNGAHTQGDLVGFTGDAEEGTCQAERVCPRPLPDDLIDIKARLADIALHTHSRGGTRMAKGKAPSKAARRHKNKKNRK